MFYKLPYGKNNMNFELPGDRVKAVLTSSVESYDPGSTEEELVKKAIISPIASKPLKELAKGKEKIVIISSDHTRPVPSHITMPILLSEIREGNPTVDIVILVATGFHRPSTEEELRDKYGDKIVDTERIINHDSRDMSSMVKIGTLPSGGELIINKLAVEADLLIAEGFIEPHFFAGFSGGRKSVLPGIASKDTVLANHCSEFIRHEKARTGVLDGNPLHEDMVYAAKKAGLAFILNVILNDEKKIINAFAGEREKAHEEGCQFLSSLAGVGKTETEIVITSNGGYPLDQNIYQSVKSMTAAEACCKENGVIIVATECSDGHGGESFYKTFAEGRSVQQIMDRIDERSRSETIPDQWESQVLARILLKNNVILVTDVSEEIVENMFMHWAPNIETAVEMADKILEKKGNITIIPDGISVIVK